MTKEEKGNMIATAVWNWLQEQKSLVYVPWVTDPKSDKFDPIKAAKQQEREAILKELEDFILVKAEELKDA